MRPFLSLSHADYHARDELSSSLLKSAELTGWEAALYAAKHRQPSRDLIVGQAMHAMMDGQFWALFAVAPESMKTANSRAFDAFEADSGGAGKTAVTQAELQCVTGMATALSARLGSAYVDGIREPSLVWRMRAFDREVDCRCRPDLVVLEGDGANYIELKSSRAPEANGWRGECYRYAYWLQESHYAAGLRAYGAQWVRTVFAVVRKSPPYDVHFHEFDAEAQAAARYRHLQLVEQYGEILAGSTAYRTTLESPATTRINLFYGPDMDLGGDESDG